MKRYNSGSRNKMIAKIKIGQKQINMDDDQYRDMLEDRYDKRSAAELNAKELADCIEHMERLGAAYTPRPQKKLADDPQARKIRSLWLELADMGAVRNRSEEALEAYVKRQTRVEKLEWLSGAEASNVIESLKMWRDRIQEQMATATQGG